MTSDAQQADGDPIELIGHSSEVTVLAFGRLPGGRPVLGAGAADGSVRLWDLPTTEPTHQLLPDPLLANPGGVKALAFGQHPDGQAVLATTRSVDGRIELWDPDTGDTLGVLAGPPDRISTLTFGYLSGGRMLLASAHQTVVNDSADRHQHTTHRPQHCTIHIWDPTTGTHARSITCPGRGVRALIVGRYVDGRDQIAAACDDGYIRLWDPDTGTLQDMIPPRWGTPRAVAFDRNPLDGTCRQIAVSDSGDIWTWWLGNYPALDNFIAETLGVHTLVLGVNASLIAAARDDGTVDVRSLYADHPRTLATGRVSALSVGPMPAVLATGHSDGTTRIWNHIGPT